MTLLAICAGGRAVRTTSWVAPGKVLRSGIVNLPAVLALHALRVHVLGDADHHHARILVAIYQNLAHRVVIRPLRVRGQELRVGFVDHHHVLRAGPVAPGEVAPAQPGSHRGQIAGRHHVNQRTRHVQSLRQLHPFGIRQSPRPVSGQGQIVRGSGGLHAGQRAHALKQRLEDRRPGAPGSALPTHPIFRLHRPDCPRSPRSPRRSAPAGIPDRHRGP